jgi:hypothetical protein
MKFNPDLIQKLGDLKTVMDSTHPKLSIDIKFVKNGAVELFL